MPSKAIVLEALENYVIQYRTDFILKNIDNLADPTILTDLIERLPEKERAPVSLRYVDKLPPSEIANILGISDTEAGNLVVHGKNRLATLFDGESFEVFAQNIAPGRELLETENDIFREFYIKMRESLIRLARSRLVLTDAAEDTVSQVFINLARAYDLTSLDLDKLPGLLVVSVINECKKVNARTRFPAFSFDEEVSDTDGLKHDIPSSAPTPDVLVEETDLLDRSISLLRALPVAQRQTLEMFLEGKTYKGISTELGIPIGTVQSRISIARRSLRRMAQETGLLAA